MVRYKRLNPASFTFEGWAKRECRYECGELEAAPSYRIFHQISPFESIKQGSKNQKSNEESETENLDNIEGGRNDQKAIEREDDESS